MSKLVLRLGWVMLAILLALPVQAQPKLKFSIASFELDPFDTTAQSEAHKKKDGSGSLYAIIRVKSNNPDDNLREYLFNFGQLKHIIDQEDHGDELWIYVQKNAKMVTISRPGYTTMARHDLGMNIMPGRNYVMQLSTQARAVYKQMVKFVVTPPDANAVVLVKSDKPDAVEEVFGIADGATGEVAKSLELGSYTYRVKAENYHDNNGLFTLSDRNALHTENVPLHANFATVTLTVAQDAEIYVNDELKGTRSWTGPLKSGNYQVECRQASHKPSQAQFFTVTDGQPLTLSLTPPTPIMGTLSVTSQPLGAKIEVDGQDYGDTPRNFDVIIGSHSVVVKKQGYKPFTTQVELQENVTVDVNAVFSPSKEEKTGKKVKPKKEKKPKKVKTPSDYSGVMKRSTVYIQAGGQVGTLMGVSAGVGAYISNFNVEVGVTMGMASDKIHAVSASQGIDRVEELKPLCYSGRIGYGIMAGKRMRITPQVGLTAVVVKDEVIQTHALSATVGVRAEYAFSSHFGVSATGEGCFAVSKKEAFEQVASLSSKVKGWGTGGNLRLGIYVTF